MAGRPGGKGLDLEESLRAYFWQAGYFVMRGLPYQIDGEDVTDIDLWLYERPAASTRRRLIVDVKNKKSPKASERIIWTRGLQAAIGVDGAIVATTDSRPGIRRLGKLLGLQVLDGEAISKITNNEKVRAAAQITLESLDEAVRLVDDQRRSHDWRNTLQDARSSLIRALGVQSVNRNLSASGYFAQQAVIAQPRSDQATTGLRLVYLTSAMAAISLDFMLAEQAFRSPEDRKKIITNAVRFGQADTEVTVPSVTAAFNLIRKYADNGQAIAKKVELRFLEDADLIKAEVIADYLSKGPRAEMLFGVARELERASSALDLPGFDQLSVDSRSILGVLLDFNGVSREKLALTWTGSQPRMAQDAQPTLDLLDREKKGS